MLIIEKNNNINVIDVYKSITSYLGKRFLSYLHPICTKYDEEIANYLDTHLTNNHQEITISDYNLGYSFIFLSYLGSEINYIRHAYNGSPNILVSVDAMSPRAYQSISDLNSDSSLLQ